MDEASSLHCICGYQQCPSASLAKLKPSRSHVNLSGAMCASLGVNLFRDSQAPLPLSLALHPFSHCPVSSCRAQGAWGRSEQGHLEPAHSQAWKTVHSRQFSHSPVSGALATGPVMCPPLCNVTCLPSIGSPCATRAADREGEGVLLSSSSTHQEEEVAQVPCLECFPATQEKSQSCLASPTHFYRFHDSRPQRLHKRAPACFPRPL